MAWKGRNWRNNELEAERALEGWEAGVKTGKQGTVEDGGLCLVEVEVLEVARRGNAWWLLARGSALKACESPGMWVCGLGSDRKGGQHSPGHHGHPGSHLLRISNGTATKGRTDDIMLWRRRHLSLPRALRIQHCQHLSGVAETASSNTHTGQQARKHRIPATATAVSNQVHRGTLR